MIGVHTSRIWWGQFVNSRRMPFVVARGAVVAAALAGAVCIWGGTQELRGVEDEEATYLASIEPEPPPKVPNAGLVMEASDLAVGDVWEQDQLLLTLTVFNPTDVDVRIIQWAGMCGGDIRPDDVTIAAGESFDFDAWIHLTPRSLADPRAVLQLGQTFVPVIEGHPGRHPGWSVTGRSLRAFRVPDNYAEWRQQGATTEVVRAVIPIMPFRSLKSFIAQSDESGVEIRTEGPDRVGNYMVEVSRDPDDPAHERSVVKLTADVDGGGESTVSVVIRDP